MSGSKGWRKWSRDLFLAFIAVIFLVYLCSPEPVHYPTTEDYIDDSVLNAFSHRFFNGSGVRLHALVSGSVDNSKGVILFLHGYPDFSGMWHAQLHYFANLGFYCVALDQRGYYVSEKPAGYESYQMSMLVEDVNSVVGTLTVETGKKPYVVAHDWGALVAFSFATLHSDDLSGMVICNGPHPAAMKMLSLPDLLTQLPKSWYVLWFQIPHLAERFFSRDFTTTYAGIAAMGRSGTVTAAEIKRGAAALALPGVIPSTLAWYRAVIRFGTGSFGLPESRVTVPTVLVWGMLDHALTPPMLFASADLCDDVRMVQLQRATHWVVREEPHIINGEILSLIQNGLPSPAAAAAAAEAAALERKARAVNAGCPVDHRAHERQEL